MCVMERQGGRGKEGVREEDREGESERASECFNAGVPFRHAFNSSAGISAIFNWKCQRMSSWKMSLGKDWRVTSNLPFKMK